MTLLLIVFVATNEKLTLWLISDGVGAMKKRFEVLCAYFEVPDVYSLEGHGHLRLVLLAEAPFEHRAKGRGHEGEDLQLSNYQRHHETFGTFNYVLSREITYVFVGVEFGLVHAERHVPARHLLARGEVPRRSRRSNGKETCFGE